MNRRPLLALLALALLLAGLGAWLSSASRARSRAAATDEAWALLAPKLPVHRCDAPPAEAYAARDVHYVHAVAEGRLAMATPAASGETTLLGLFEPVGTLTWSPEGCAVGPVKTRELVVRVVDSAGEPAQAQVASCPWLPLVETTEGRAVLEVPIAVRCKLSAHVVGEGSFHKAEAVPLPDEGGEVELVLGEEAHDIEAKRAAMLSALDQIANRPGRTAYDRAMAESEGRTHETLAVWRAQYRARQKAALARMSELATSEDGWLVLSR